jgi:hypothetical protein
MTNAMKRVVLTAAVLGLMVAAAGRAEASIVITIEQVGSDVVATGSGSLDVTDLDVFSTNPSFPDLVPSQAYVLLGPRAFESIDYGFTVKGPSSFGAAAGNFASSGSGDAFGVFGGGGPATLIVPDGYTSGTALSGSATFDNATIGGPGLIPGTYVYTWGNGAHADSLTVQIGPAAVPEPATLAGGALGAALALGWAQQRRRAKAAG